MSRKHFKSSVEEPTSEEAVATPAPSVAVADSGVHPYDVTLPMAPIPTLIVYAESKDAAWGAFCRHSGILATDKVPKVAKHEKPVTKDEVVNAVNADDDIRANPEKYDWLPVVVVE